MHTLWRKICIYGIPPLAVLIGAVIFQVKQNQAAKAAPPASAEQPPAIQQPVEPQTDASHNRVTNDQEWPQGQNMTATDLAPEPESESPVLEPPLSLQVATENLVKLAARLSDNQLWRQWLARSDILVKFVRLLDDISNGDRPVESAGFLRQEQPFVAVRNQEGAWVIAAATAKRYDFAVDVFCSLQPDAVARLYPRLEPALQEALNKLGYRDRHFKELLTSACTAILSIPIVEEHEQLICADQGGVYCRWQNPELEALTDAQKLFLRLGASNTTRARAQLLRLAEALELYAVE